MDILTNLKESLFQEKITQFSPVTPIPEMIDVELGNINTELHKYNLEMKDDRLDNPDLELGFGPIVEMTNNHIIIRMQKTNTNNHVIDNYYSLFDSLNYISMSYQHKERQEQQEKKVKTNSNQYQYNQYQYNQYNQYT